MFNFFKKKKIETDDSNEELMEELQNIFMSEKNDSEKVGFDIADDCVNNGLLAGEIVKLSDIENLITQQFKHNPVPKKTAFMKKMSEYVDEGTVICMTTGEDDFVYVHKDYIDEFLRKYT